MAQIKITPVQLDLTALATALGGSTGPTGPTGPSGTSGPTGLAASAIGTNTTVVAPVYTGVIWRISVIYRLGL